MASGRRIQAHAIGHKPSPLLAALFGLLLILSSAPARAEQLQDVSEDSLNLTFLMLQKLSGTAAAGADLYSNGGEDGLKLISRQLLFGIPERVGVQISPDGSWLSYLSAESGFFNIWIAPVNRLPAASEGRWTLKPDLSSARPLTNETIRGIESYFWADTGRHIIFSLDTFGDENWHIYSLDIETGERLDLTPYGNVSAYVLATSNEIPEEILVGINERDREYHDLYQINITTGMRSLVLRNDRFAGFLAGDDLRVLLAVDVMADGIEYLQTDGIGSWKPFMKIDYLDSATTYPLGFDRKEDILYMAEGRGRDTAALTSWNLRTGRTEILAQDPSSDLGWVLFHPTSPIVQAVSFEYYRHNWTVLDESIRPDLEYLQQLNPGDLMVTSRTSDDSIWIAGFISDSAPARYYLYDRRGRVAEPLFSANRMQERLPLSKMHCVTIRSRDGLDMVSYLSLPPWTDEDGDGMPNEPLPMVLYVHGGPWTRDSWGFDETHQLLANRGYAVLSVNFRGSSGFGKRFINAGDGEWGGKMEEDLLDAVRWSIEKGIADPDRIAILGLSYGGYAALSALANTGGLFACGVDICGPSNLTSFLLTLPEYWNPSLEVKLRRVGDYRTEEGRRMLDERSPLSRADRIERPLLIAQGANDPRVKRNESEQIVRALVERGVPVTYALFPDEGHGFVRPGNGLAFYALTEAFLAEHLGGRYEPIGPALNGSSITVPVGADQIPGLAQALAHKSP
ncbi:S9 family peptidase [Methanothrix sp.]|uniref:S9 family peptidase n=1 Tax=Methanothrix sp. TaxID=90426 RepID=UPI0025F839D6|nr:S9 family peptidase [Methanothrix sp.]